MDEVLIGRVVATERNPTTSNTIQFWVGKDIIIKPFDFVMVHHIGKSRTYAIITELKHLTDSAGYLADWVSSDFGDVSAEPRNARIGTTVAEAEILYNDKNIEMPVLNGSKVVWADTDGVRKALGLDDMRCPIPAGWFKMSNGEEVMVDLEGNYLIGPEGAHLNIAGISGLATKTSYAMFLFSALQQKRRSDVSLVVFNVKGYDLLSIDEKANGDNFSPEDEAAWQKCGLDPKPFDNVTYFYPYQENPNQGYKQSKLPADVHRRQVERNACYHYVYPVENGKEKLSLLLSDIDDPQDTMDACVEEIIADKFGTWQNLRDEIGDRSNKGTNSKKGYIQVQSWRKFSRLIRTRTKNDMFAELAISHKEKRRQCITADILNHLAPGRVVVIDIEPLPDYLQALVFGDVLKTIIDAQLGNTEEAQEKNIGRVVIFADELNKYAPKQSASGSALTSNLLEITERGRSLGIILMGAEQFRSGVHDRVLGNCATNVFGRTSPVEIKKGQEYRILNQTQQSTLTRLPQGTLMIQHPVFTSAVVKVQFPRPAYAQPKGGAK